MANPMKTVVLYEEIEHGNPWSIFGLNKWLDDLTQGLTLDEREKVLIEFGTVYEHGCEYGQIRVYYSREMTDAERSEAAREEFARRAMREQAERNEYAKLAAKYGPCAPVRA